MSQSEWVWSTTRQQIIEAFGGETPGEQIEKAVTAIFEQRPWSVDSSYAQVAAALQRGEITSGWAILRKRLEDAGTPQREVVVSGHKNREKLVARAEQWMHATGIHIDRASELEDELFGDIRLNPQTAKDGEPIAGNGRGILQPFASDDVLRKRMIGLWQTLRPQGEQIDQEADERGRKLIADRQAAYEAAKQKLAQAQIREKDLTAA